MATQALYRKYRPQVWDDVVYQEQVTRVLKNAIRSGRIGHAYLFSGPRGTGKTTVARILARAVNCLDNDLGNRPCDQCANCISVNKGQFMDLIEIDAASNTSVDDIRDLRDKINFAPSVGRKKVYIIDEVHMLSTAAFNALLKTLEEPPSHAMFILATTEMHKIPATVLSRCQHHEFRRIPVNEIAKHLAKICEKENISYEMDALTLIARQSTGAMRDAISMLDQMASSGEGITAEAAQQILGVATSQAVINLVEAIISKKQSEGLNAIHEALESGTDPNQFARQMVEYLRQLMITKMGTGETLDVTAETRSTLASQSAKAELSRLVSVTKIFNEAALDSRADWHPGLNLELAFAESCEEKADQSGEVVKVIEKQIIREVPAAQAQNSAIRGSTSEAKPQVTGIIDVEDMEEDLSMLQNRVFIRSGQKPDPSVTLELVNSRWKDVLALIGKHDAVMTAALKHAKIMDVKNGVLLLGFPRETIFHKVEENTRFLVWTSAAIKNVVGKSVGVSCVVLGSNKMGNSPAVKTNEALNTALQLGGKLVVNK